jgi:hypothetical protein
MLFSNFHCPDKLEGDKVCERLCMLALLLCPEMMTDSGIFRRLMQNGGFKDAIVAKKMHVIAFI